MKKKFALILLSFIISFAFVLTGCDLFPRNVSAYLNQPVVTIEYSKDDILTITTEEFINAYNNYGASLVSQSKYTYSQAAEKTIDVLISRAVLLKEAKKTIMLTNQQIKNVLGSTYDSLISSLSSYETAVYEDWDITKPSAMESTSTSTSTTYGTYKAYEPTAEVVLVNGEYKIKLIETEEQDSQANFSDVNAVISAFKKYANPTDSTNVNRVTREAYRRYIAYLKNSENGMNLSTDEASILSRQVNKLYQSLLDNKYITELEDNYKSESEYSTISVRQVLDAYKALMIKSKFTYTNDLDAYNTAMLDTFKDVNYVVNDNYFFVSNLLFKFSTEQQSQYDALSENLKAGYISEGSYKQQVNELVAQVKATERDSEGNVISTNKSATEVLQQLQTELSHVSTDEAKTEIFKNYLYKYGEDTGVVNADYPYVIGKTTSRMVDSFNEASRELNNNGIYGEISELTASSYGVHIIFYEGKVTNLFTIDNMSTFELKDEDIMKLVNTKLNQLNNKTVFDKIYTTLSNDTYSIFENMNLNILKKDLKITKYSDVYLHL